MRTAARDREQLQETSCQGLRKALFGSTTNQGVVAFFGNSLTKATLGVNQEI
ncbi:unnamed protein product [Acidithrix sp. C25]|nr:unnamed protein product [Acidithrix sp. C25]